jgi:DNA-binding XRE family transcriptional regulator
MPDEICVLDGLSPETEEAAPNLTLLENYARVVQALRRSTTNSTWVVASPSRFTDLVRAVSESRRDVYRLRLFSYERPDPTTALLLESVFERPVLGPRATIPLHEMVEVLRSRHREDYCIAAQWLENAGSVALWRGDFSMLTVPLAWFRGDGAPTADPARLSVENFGQTIRLGDYEAAFDAVLYEFDARARARMRARMRAQDRSLGGSIRRLREMKGVRREEFGGVDAKTIARIERGEVSTPQRATLAAIADRLGVPVEKLESY